MKITPFRRRFIVVLAAVALGATVSANPEIVGQWQLDVARSSALAGRPDMRSFISSHDTQVDIRHEMRWRSTRYRATNTVDTAKSVASDSFFRVEQRHKAVYPAKGGVTHTTAEWIDDNRTLRTETHTPVEVSKGNVNMRITSEYRIGEGGKTLTLIELHSSRSRPLVYFFRKVEEEVSS